MKTTTGGDTGELRKRERAGGRGRGKKSTSKSSSRQCNAVKINKTGAHYSAAVVEQQLEKEGSQCRGDGSQVA